MKSINKIEPMNTIIDDNVAVCRGTQKFIRDPKSNKRDSKMTKDNKSHKKVLKDKVAKRVKESLEKNPRVEEEDNVKFRIPEPKKVKIV